jgi:hypothetical protein
MFTKTLAGHKQALKNEWKQLEPTVIIKYDKQDQQGKAAFNETLLSWPKRYRLIYNIYGSHIEHLLQ